MTTARSSKWPSRLVIMRHAESEANLRREYLKTIDSHEHHVGLECRDVDVRLTAHGREQARTTGLGLNDYGPFHVVYVSPYQRTRETAALVVEQIDTPPRVVSEERVREKEFGILEGLTRHGIKARHPEEAERKVTMGKYYYRPPGGESFPDVNLRVHSFLGTMIREWSGRRVLVVTHSVVVLCFRRLLERMEEREVLDLDRQDDVKNASLLIYEPGTRNGRQGVVVRKAWNLTLWNTEKGRRRKALGDAS
jgi:broad specificity phosphatase PhoE